ncbi:hypothetical protein C2857_004549 [Epichloe festucae Fl1]|uniref:Uncharacterized protein n=1 Tax=Epichloe festucae (strain Fl1) TaxID=877507 RepID=A0A7S9KKL8_EPIFF|nr:hypothetical protein C2857_004549 [Epichloe festucae Fl1]
MAMATVLHSPPVDPTPLSALRSPLTLTVAKSNQSSARQGVIHLRSASDPQTLPQTALLAGPLTCSIILDTLSFIDFPSPDPLPGTPSLANLEPPDDWVLLRGSVG